MRPTQLLNNFKFPPLPSNKHLKELCSLLARSNCNRSFLVDDKVADEIIDKIGIENIKDRTILEYSSGPGLMTRKFLNTGIRGLIPLERSRTFIELYKELERISNIPILYEHFNYRPSRDLYSMLFDIPLEKRGKIQIDTCDWDKIHPNILFFGICNTINEAYSFYFTLCQFIDTKQGFLNYGRFPIYLICPPEVVKSYTKASLLGFSIKAMGNIESNYKLNRKAFIQAKNLELVKFVPFSKPKIKASYNTFCYVTTCLMHRKAQAVQNCLDSIAPGVSAIKEHLDFNVNKKCSELSLNELDNIALEYIRLYNLRYNKDPIHII